MDLGKITRDSEDRDVRKAALVAGVLGLGTLVSGVIVWRMGGSDWGLVAVSIGVIQLSLAYGVYRGSRACAMAVLALFALDRFLAFATAGIMGVLNLWTIGGAVMLWAGMRGVFAQHARGTGKPAAG